MTRSRSINRFHRFVARKRRRGLRSVLPHLRRDGSEAVDQRDLSNRLIARSEQMDLRQELDELGTN